MSKWAALLEKKYAVVLPCDDRDKTRQNPFCDSHNGPFVAYVPFVPFVPEESEVTALEDCKVIRLERHRRTRNG